MKVTYTIEADGLTKEELEEVSKLVKDIAAFIRNPFDMKEDTSI